MYLLALAGAVITWCALDAVNRMGRDVNGWAKAWWCLTGVSGFWAVLVPFSDTEFNLPWPVVALICSLAVFCWKHTHRSDHKEVENDQKTSWS